jgi:hypothetical protein
MGIRSGVGFATIFDVLDGDRGAGHFYATGNSWTDGVADATPPLPLQIGDRVTISNGTDFSETQTYTGATGADKWLVVEAYIDGNLLVNGAVIAELVAAQDMVVTGSITAENATYNTKVSIDPSKESPITIDRDGESLLRFDADGRLEIKGGLASQQIDSVSMFSDVIWNQIKAPVSEGATGGSFKTANLSGGPTITTSIDMTNTNTATVGVACRFGSTSYGPASTTAPRWRLTITASKRAVSGSESFINAQTLHARTYTGFSSTEPGTGTETDISINFAQEFNLTNTAVGGDIRITFTVQHEAGSQNQGDLFSISSTQAVQGGGQAGEATTLNNQSGSYYLDYKNFKNVPPVVTSSLIDNNVTIATVKDNKGLNVTQGAIEVGEGSGSVALTINDGGGNANLTFNHKNLIPDTNGNSGRIHVNVDATGGVPSQMDFQLGSNSVANTSKDLGSILQLRETDATLRGDLFIHKQSGGGGVGLKFSDLVSGDQSGYVKYYHNDGESYGSSNAFVHSTNQASTSHVFDVGTNNNGMKVISGGASKDVLHTGNIGSGGLATVTTSATDTTAGRLLKVGDFGIGEQSNLDYPRANLDDLTIPNGHYRLTNTNPSTGVRPLGFSAYATIDVSGYDNSNKTQVITDVNGKRAYRTLRSSGTTPWYTLLHDGNIPTWNQSTTGNAATATNAADSAKLGGVSENEGNISSTIVKRNFRGDISARLFRSEYTSQTSTANFLMTQNALGTAEDNYIRPISIANFIANHVKNTIVDNASNAAFSDRAKWIDFPDGPRNLSDRTPDWNNRSVAFDFVGKSTVGGSGNYAGVMTFAPWSGTTSSTGDASYQLAFCNRTGVNASGIPDLKLRNGIDTTWNTWHTLWHSGNGGTNSGLDADKLDGIHASQFLRGDTNDVINGSLTIGGTTVTGNEGGELRFTPAPNSSHTSTPYLDSHLDNLRYVSYAGGVTRVLVLPPESGKVLHTGNMGSGSGLDADKLDGVEGSSFLRSDTNDSFSGLITGNTLHLGSSQIMGSTAKLQVNGFMRTGNIMLHEGNGSPTTAYEALSNSSGTLQWKDKEVYTRASTSMQIDGRITSYFDGTDSISMRKVADTNYAGMSWKDASGTARWLLYTSNNAKGNLQLQGRRADGSYQHTTWDIDNNTGRMNLNLAPTVEGEGALALDSKFADYTTTEDGVAGMSAVPDDYWNGSNNSLNITNIGLLGTEGAYRTSWTWNGYRNKSGGFTYRGVNGNTTTASVLEHDSEGLRYRAGSASGSSLPQVFSVGSSGNLDVTGHIYTDNGKALVMGNSSDFRIRFDGANALLDNFTGNIYTRNFVSGGHIYHEATTTSGSIQRVMGIYGGASTFAELSYDNSVKLSTETHGITVNGSSRGTSEVVAGHGSGSVSININDGGGNANVAFNHAYLKPDVSGNSGRITVNADVTTGAHMQFQLLSGTIAGNAVPLSVVFQLEENKASFNHRNGLLEIYSTVNDINAESTLRLNGQSQQGVDIRLNTYDSNRPPFGVHIERAKSNGQTTSKAYLEVEGDVIAGEYMYAKSHGSGIANSKVLTYDDFLPDTPPVGLENTISANWISAGAIQAKHLQINGGSSVNGSKRSFKINPDSERPLSFALLNDDLSVQKDIFYVDSDGNAYLNGKLSKDTVDIESIQEDARKQINPYYSGTSPNSTKEITTSGTGGSIETPLPAVTIFGGNCNVSWKLDVSEQYFDQSSSQNWTKPVWRVRVYRNSVSGTPIVNKVYTGSVYNYYDQDAFGYNGSAQLKIEDFFYDENAPANEVYVLYVTRESGTATSITRRLFRAHSASFNPIKMKLDYTTLYYNAAGLDGGTINLSEDLRNFEFLSVTASANDHNITHTNLIAVADLVRDYDQSDNNQFMLFGMAGAVYWQVSPNFNWTSLADMGEAATIFRVSGVNITEK